MSEMNEKPAYTPPSVSWRLMDFVEAPLTEIEARVVTCETCPVAAKCAAGVDGTGWSMKCCKATGVYVDDGGVALRPIGTEFPKDVLVLDCTKHRFAVKGESELLPKCSLCNGNAIELDLIASRGGCKFEMGRAHYIATAYSAMPVAERQAQLKAGLETARKMLATVDDGIAAKAKEEK